MNSRATGRRVFKSGNSKTWDALREEQIHLSEIHTDIIVDGLLEYLSSYSGLERLTVASAGGGDEELSERCADEFFSTLLTHQRQSLVGLSCYGAYEGRWSFGAHNADILAQLSKLRCLRMKVNAESHGHEQGPRKQGGRNTYRGRGLREIFEIESDLEGRNMVHRFLELMNQLPITEAAILPSCPERYTKPKCGNNKVRHLDIVIARIDAAVREFKSLGGRGSSAVVLAGYNYYKMERGESRYRAVESVNLSEGPFYDDPPEEYFRSTVISNFIRYGCIRRQINWV
ncbi:hypothetical protein B0H19DRAFT_1254113 [Mycena capillaripes]|nr:hypothetical protein B0H19DRAFT_1254113 [Mycena capillaripes]